MLKPSWLVSLSSPKYIYKKVKVILIYESQKSNLFHLFQFDFISFSNFSQIFIMFLSELNTCK